MISILVSIFCCAERLKSFKFSSTVYYNCPIHSQDSTVMHAIGLEPHRLLLLDIYALILASVDYRRHHLAGCVHRDCYRWPTGAQCYLHKDYDTEKSSAASFRTNYNHTYWVKLNNTHLALSPSVMTIITALHHQIHVLQFDVLMMAIQCPDVIGGMFHARVENAWISRIFVRLVKKK